MFKSILLFLLISIKNYTAQEPENWGRGDLLSYCEAKGISISARSSPVETAVRRRAVRRLGEVEILYNQFDNDRLDNALSSEIPISNAADDFVVPLGETWQITRVSAPFAWGGSPNSFFTLVQAEHDEFVVTFYRDDGGSPGDIICNQTRTATDGGSDQANGIFPFFTFVMVEIDIEPVVLGNGHYWISIQLLDALNDITIAWFWGASFGPTPDLVPFGLPANPPIFHGPTYFFATDPPFTAAPCDVSLTVITDCENPIATGGQSPWDAHNIRDLHFILEGEVCRNDDSGHGSWDHEFEWDHSIWENLHNQATWNKCEFEASEWEVVGEPAGPPPT